MHDFLGLGLKDGDNLQVGDMDEFLKGSRDFFLSFYELIKCNNCSL